MAIQTNYTRARANLASLCSQVIENRETVIIKRRGSEDVALISASELSRLMETAHLLSPKKRPATAQGIEPRIESPDETKKLRDTSSRDGY